jgi:hypothetical protein
MYDLTELMLYLDKTSALLGESKQSLHRQILSSTNSNKTPKSLTSLTGESVSSSHTA